MFLTENDYIVASADALTIFSQSTPKKREKAEKMAIEEIAGYLRSRYDTGLIFSAVGDNRNDVIVMHACDITLYHLVSWLPGKMGREIRKEALRTGRLNGWKKSRPERLRRICQPVPARMERKI